MYLHYVLTCMITSVHMHIYMHTYLYICTCMYASFLKACGFKAFSEYKAAQADLNTLHRKGLWAEYESTVSTSADFSHEGMSLEKSTDILHVNHSIISKMSDWPDLCLDLLRCAYPNRKGATVTPNRRGVRANQAITR